MDTTTDTTVFPLFSPGHFCQKDPRLRLGFRQSDQNDANKHHNRHTTTNTTTDTTTDTTDTMPDPTVAKKREMWKIPENVENPEKCGKSRKMWKTR